MAKLYQGYQLRKQKEAEAVALREARNRRMAATTRDMAEEERRKEFMQSRAVALAAASGGGVDDPTVVNLMGDLAAEGEYRVMAKMWRGLDEAEGLTFRAEAARREGRAAFEGGVISTMTDAAKFAFM